MIVFRVAVKCAQAGGNAHGAQERDIENVEAASVTATVLPRLRGRCDEVGVGICGGALDLRVKFAVKRGRLSGERAQRG